MTSKATISRAIKNMNYTRKRLSRYLKKETAFV
jgi:hypothetical protein